MKGSYVLLNVEAPGATGMTELTSEGVRGYSSTLIFLHIPKTAGRTLEKILEREYAAEFTYNIYGYDQSILEAAKQLSLLPNRQLRSIRLIKGHYNFGLHKLLPQGARYITFLREPIDRIVSHYFYVKEWVVDNLCILLNGYILQPSVKIHE